MMPRQRAWTRRKGVEGTDRMKRSRTGRRAHRDRVEAGLSPRSTEQGRDCGYGGGRRKEKAAMPKGQAV